MIVALLLMILSGSFATATTMALQDASWVMIGLGYVLGGWAGLFLGISVTGTAPWLSGASQI